MNILKEDLYYVGVNDHQVDLFESQYVVPNGMSYNSYVLIDEKIAIFDTVDQHFFNQWYANIKEVLGDRKPDYLVVSHMEPDHSANIKKFMDIYPDTTVICTALALKMIDQFFHFKPKNVETKTEGDTLKLGKHTLSFYMAQMVHWPEVMVTYDDIHKTLFSADAFGKFGALDVDEPWEDEARRYYIGIVGKYGLQTLNLLKKAGGLDIQMICPLHGPILKENLFHYINYYYIWGGYRTEKEGVAIFYTSVYGHTREAVEYLKEKLEEKKQSVVIYDLARSDMSKCVADAFSYGKIVLATTTYNTGIFPFMNDFINHLVERNFQNKQVGIIENGSWAPLAAKVIKDKLTNCENISYLDSVKIMSSLSEANYQELDNLAEKLK